jgi:hypothetical protein
MPDERQFPIMASYRRAYPDLPRSIPWRLLAPHEAQAKRNHGGQDLETLARRGGLDPVEMIAVLDDLPWDPKWTDNVTRLSDCVERLVWIGTRTP